LNAVIDASPEISGLNALDELLNYGSVMHDYEEWMTRRRRSDTGYCALMSSACKIACAILRQARAATLPPFSLRARVAPALTGRFFVRTLLASLFVELVDGQIWCAVHTRARELRAPDFRVARCAPPSFRWVGLRAQPRGDVILRLATG
jgi:hypothetical protein